MNINTNTQKKLIKEYKKFLKNKLDSEESRFLLYRILLYNPRLIFPKSPFRFKQPIYSLTPRRKYIGMTTIHEQAFCEWFASHLFRGKGDWVELGTFLGSLTKPSAIGLSVNPFSAAKSKKIRVFDLFYWDPIMVDSIKDTPFQNCFKEGDWYCDFYKAFISEIIDWVEVNQVDLTKYCYTGEPIEFLVVDVMKYESLVVNVLKEFFPFIIPNKGYLFHQDYLHFYEGWITLSMYKLRDFFERVCHIHESPGVVFKCKKSVPKEELEFPSNSSDISIEWINEAFDWSFSQEESKNIDIVAATKVMMFIHANLKENACRYYRDCKAKFPFSKALQEVFEYVKVNREFDLNG